MKTHRIIALLCAGILALSPVGAGYAYAAELPENVVEQSEAKAVKGEENLPADEVRVPSAGSDEQGNTDQGGNDQGSSHQAETDQGDNSQGSADQGSSNQGNADQGSTNQAGTNQGSADQESTNQTGSAQDSTDQTGSAQGSTNQDGSAQGGTNQDGSAQDSTNQDGSALGSTEGQSADADAAAGEAEEVESEIVQGEMKESLLPLEEKQAALILNDYSETELKKVKVSYIVDNLLDPDGNYYNFGSQDHFIWSYYKDEYGEVIRDEYHEVTRNSTVDMSVFDDNSAGYKMELIVGDGSQLGKNTRYIVNVYLTNSISEFNTLELWTQDAQGKRSQVSAERLKHTVSGSEFYVPGHKTGTKYYLAINSEIINHPYFNVEVYTEAEYEKRLSNGWQNASAITDSIVNPNMRQQGQGYLTALDEPNGMSFVLVVENPETHNIYHARKHKVVVKGSSTYIESSVWTRVNGELVRAAAMDEKPADWSMYAISEDSDGIETQTLTMLEGKDEYEEFFITLAPHHDVYGSDASRYIAGIYEGNYDTAAAASQAGAANLKDKLLADPSDSSGDAFDGYSFTKEQLYTSRNFTVFWTDGTVCKIQINITRANNDQSYTRWEDYYSEPVVGEQDPWFRVTGVKLGDRELDAYVVENGKSKTLDTYYGMGYQTLFINEYVSEEDIKSLKPIFWVADSDQIRIRTNAKSGAAQTTAQGAEQTAAQTAAQGTEEKSGVTAHDFSSPVAYYALFEGRQKNYIVEVVPKVQGPKLYVFGADGTEYERNREIFLDDYYQYRHDILIANVGDQKLEGLSVRLENASHVKIDDYWTVGGEGNDTLEPFTSVAKTQEYGELQNLAKVRVVSDGAGDITGDLIISAKGQESVVIHLSGSAIQPVIRTTDLTYAVKYVPYSYIISTSNMNEKVDVTYELKGKLPAGMRFDAKTGELYGVPMEAGTYTFTVKVSFSEQSFEPSTQQLTLEVKENEDDIVFNATDEGYEIIPEEDGMKGYVGEQVSEYKFELADTVTSEMFISNGEFSEFTKVWINGVELQEGTEYLAEPGSTVIQIFLDNIRKRKVIKEGKNTIAAEYKIKRPNKSGDSGSGNSSGSSGGGYDSWKSNGGGGGGSSVRRTSQNFWTNSSSKPAVAKYFKISKTSVNLHTGKQTTLKISKNYTTSIKWSSTNTKVAKVNASGKVTAVGKGNCTIVAKSGDGRTQKCKVHVMIPVKTITLNRTSMRLGAGHYYTLQTTVTPSNVDKKDFVWTSSNTKIATVNASGRVKGISKGTCTITVKTPNGKKRTCKVTVYNIIPVTSVKLNAHTKTLNKGASYTLKATIAPSNASNKKLTWYSSNTKVAKVTASGKVIAVGAGKARIKVKSNNGKSDSCLVTVKLVPVSSIALKLDRLLLHQDAATKLVAEFLPANASDKTTVWSSSDETVATVENGTVTGITQGTAVITVTSSNGLSASCEVTVVDPDMIIPDINLSSKMLEILEGETAAIEAELISDGEMDETLAWESTRPDVAAVDETGVVTAQKAGYATIIARTVYNTVATCSVHVKAPTIDVTKITLDRSSVTLNPGYNDQKTAELTAQVLPVNATDKTVTWTSANETIAVVKDGVVSARSAGTTTVTATSSNGLTATCKVTVVEGPKRISTVQDLIAVNEDLQADYILANDIDLGNMDWTPIGSGADGFYGSFDGNGYTITGLNVSGKNFSGLFDTCRGTIKNLTVYGKIHADLNHYSVYAGGICAYSYQGTINNCESNVDIYCRAWHSSNCYIYCGGIVGNANRCTLRNCRNHGNIECRVVNSPEMVVSAGGIAGSAMNHPFLENCTSDGDVSGYATPNGGAPYVVVGAGGIIGEVSTGATCNNCSSSGTIGAYADTSQATSKTSYVAAGGIVGTKDVVDLSGCTSSASLHTSCNTATTEQFTGSIIGCAQVTSLGLNTGSATINLGDSYKLTATIYPSDASSKKLIWTSSDESVATVSNGTVRAVGVGKATIKVNAVTGGYGTCVINVKNPDTTQVSEIKVSAAGGTYVGVGQSVQCTATVLPDTATDKSYVWASSDTSVASIDQNGVVTTHKAGTASITATAANGVKGSLTLHVLKAHVEIGGNKSFVVNRGEKISIPIRLYLDGTLTKGAYQYILYTAYYNAGWVELASFNIDGNAFFEQRYVGKAMVTDYTVSGNIVDLTLEIDTSKVEKVTSTILTIDVFPYDNFATGGSIDNDSASLTIQ